MRLDLYQAETARIAAEQSALLAQVTAMVAENKDDFVVRFLLQPV